MQLCLQGLFNSGGFEGAQCDRVLILILNDQTDFSPKFISEFKFRNVQQKTDGRKKKTRNENEKRGDGIF